MHAIEAARTRLRPILMTYGGLILGVVPLMIATGAGAELRQALGTAVFFGMLGVTLFGLVFTPVFYVLVRWIAGCAARKRLPIRLPTRAEQRMCLGRGRGCGTLPCSCRIGGIIRVV